VVIDTVVTCSSATKFINNISITELLAKMFEKISDFKVEFLGEYESIF
jgi:hypothetical protein